MPPAQRPDQFRPVASLPVISLSKLYGQSALEYDKVQKACTNTGIFYLDLDGCPEILSLWTELLRFSEAYFTQPLEAKQKNDHRSELYGYEAVGTSKGLSAEFVNGYESLKFAHYSPIMAGAPLRGEIIERNRAVVQKFQHSAHDILMRILDCLPGDNLSESHHPDRPSKSNSVFLRYPKDAPSEASGHNEHNDMGSLTLLLTLQWGLQFRDPVDDVWKYVAPMPTRATVNVGDSLSYISEGLYRPALHRVTRINDGLQEDKYSISLFLRPADDAQYKDGDGKPMTAESWHKIRIGQKKGWVESPSQF